MTEDEAKGLEELLRDKTVVCAACGTEMPDNALLCPKCGRFNASPIFAAPVSPGSTLQASVTQPPLQADHEPERTPLGPSNAPGSVSVAESASTSLDGESLFAAPMRPVSFGQPVEVSPPESAVGEGPVQAPEPQQSAIQAQARREASLTRSERQVRHYNYAVGRPEETKQSTEVRAAQAFRREMFAYVGFLGAGHIYAGHVARGLALMLGWWVFLPWTLVTLFSNNGGACLFLVAMLVPLLSGLWASASVKR